MAAAAASSSRRAEHEARLPNVAIFPFMAKGHTIPLTHLAHLLLRRGLATVTFFTSPGNAAFVRAALSPGADGSAIVELPFPDHVSGVPPGVEGVEALESLSSFPALVEAVSLLRPRFEEALAAMRPRAGLLVADALLYWAHASAAALGVPRVAFSGASMFAYVMREVFLGENPAAVLRSDDGAPAVATFTVPEFPHVQLVGSVEVARAARELMAPGENGADQGGQERVPDGGEGAGSGGRGRVVVEGGGGDDLRALPSSRRDERHDSVVASAWDDDQYVLVGPCEASWSR